MINRIYTTLKNIKTQRGPHIDGILILIVFLLAGYGTLMVFSAGYSYAEYRYDDAYYFIKKQAIWLTVGIASMFLSSLIDVGIFKRLTPIFYVVTLALLVMVLIFGFVGNGAQRWISIGPLTIQPSEIAKLTLIMAMARYFSDNAPLALDRKSKKHVFIYGTLIPIVIMIIPIILVMLQKHLSH